MSNIERRINRWQGPERRKVGSQRAADTEAASAPSPDPVELQSRISLLRLQRDDIDRQITALSGLLIPTPAPAPNEDRAP